jgi:sulfur carrier protein ThiS
MINVSVGKFPSTPEDVQLSDGATVSQALEAAGLDSHGWEVRVNGGVATADTAVNDGDVVLLMKQIKAN